MYWHIKWRIFQCCEYITSERGVFKSLIVPIYLQLTRFGTFLVYGSRLYENSKSVAPLAQF